MEGDRLEILLLARRIEALRSFGRALQSPGENRGLLPNIDACIHRSILARVGLCLLKEFPRHGTFGGKITAIDEDDPEKFMYQITYDDGDVETMDINELKPLLSTYGDALRGKVIAGLSPAFTYLEQRLTGGCESCYDCTHAYLICTLAAAFDPSHANEKQIDAALVRSMAAINPLAEEDGLLVAMEGELPSYLSHAAGASFDHSDAGAFTEAMLLWWKNHKKELPAWAKAARIMFALTPNSAAAERVFSLLKNMFTDDQLSSLGDMLQGSLMLRYNKRQM